MTASVDKLKERRSTFGWVFVVSFVPFLASFSYLAWVSTLFDLTGVALFLQLPAVSLFAISLLASLASSIGFFSTAVLARRREKRDMRQSKVGKNRG